MLQISAPQPKGADNEPSYGSAMEGGCLGDLVVVMVVTDFLVIHPLDACLLWSVGNE